MATGRIERQSEPRARRRLRRLPQAGNDARIASGVFNHNAASLAIQAKLGFVVTGRSLEDCPARGAKLEHVNTELARSGLKKARRRLKVGVR